MKKRKICLLTLSALATLCSCNNLTIKEKTTTIIDSIGREVEINPGTYKNVVCIGAGALRLYSYIGDVDLLSGVEDIDNYTLESRPKMFDSSARPYFIAYKEEFSKLPSCGVGGPNAQTAEAEKILSCNPDIVISEYEDVVKEDSLEEEIGVPVITVSYGSKGVFDENLTYSLNLLGKVFDKEERAEELISYISKEKEEIISLTSSIKSNKNAYICGLGNWGTTDYLMTAQNYEPFNIANINNVVNDLTVDGIQKIDKEKFVSLGEKIDVMIIDVAAIKNIAPLYKEDPTIFDSVKAWNENEVYLEMPYNAYYTNIEIALVNTRWYVKVFYEEEFKDFNIDEKLDEVTSFFLNKELSKEIYACETSYGGYQKIDTTSFFDNLI